MENRIQNPILPGFYPDPSICRVGEDFYLITSSFETCPAIPVFHSRDLAHWEQLSYALTPENGLKLECNSFRGGVMAPTIRYHKGIYYIINMNFSQGGNFILTATDPSGPWSEPQLLPDVPGIDASIFFDEDDRCYVVSTGDVRNPDGKTERGIWAQEFDMEHFCTVGERHDIWNCALRDATSPEAPHIYKKDGWYYLLISEGGTEHFHAITVARAKHLFDWYEGNPANPVLTHRHLGYRYPIDNVGHGDLVELPDGSWYAVVLGSRIIGGQYKNLGRETYLCPVVWERGWPVFAPETGKVEWTLPAVPSLPWTPYPEPKETDDFDGETLALPWIFWGVPEQKFWRLQDGALHIQCLPRAIDRLVHAIGPAAPEVPEDADTAAVVLRRQQHVSFDAYTKMTFRPEGHEAAGLILMQGNNNHFRMELFRENGMQYLRVVEVSSKGGLMPYQPGFRPTTVIRELARQPWSGGEVLLCLKVRGQSHDFYYGTDADHLQSLYLGADGRKINEEVSGGMVGSCLGMFASGNGQASTKEASFDFFTYRPVETVGEYWK